MTRTRIALIATTALVSMLGAALPAFAQAPAPAPMYAPAPAPAPGYVAPAPAPEAGAVMPVAPVMAPRSGDDMTGSVGFGVGVTAGTTDLLTIDQANLMMKYWMSDAMSIVPRLDLAINHVKGAPNTPWAFAPSVLANFVLLKGASTRLDAGLGLGIALAKNMAADIGHRSAAFAGDGTATYFGIFVPVQIGVEHFFTRWFSMGIAANFDFLRFEKQGDPWRFGLAVNNINYMGSLFIYTD